MKVALIHDYLVQYGGGERVLDVMSDMFPEAPIYTLVYDPQAVHGAFQDKDVRTSFLQNIPFTKSHHRLFPLLMPMGVENWDLSEYDVVLSSSSSYAKGVITPPGTTHISYCHTPTRYAWDNCHRYFQEFRYNTFVKRLLPFAVNYIRMWDKVSADRVDYYIANSHNVARRIEKYYHMPARVIHPPVNIDRFQPAADHDDYYLMLGRFLVYKHYDIVIQAFQNSDRKLKIVGTGPEEEYLKSLARGCENIEFLGRLSDEDSKKAFERCRAFIFPSEDDFGIVPVEAMAAGKPVIAYGVGGACETVEDGVTGVFFSEQTPQSVKEAVDRFETMHFDSQVIAEHVSHFSYDRFRQELEETVETLMTLHL